MYIKATHSYFCVWLSVQCNKTWQIEQSPLDLKSNFTTSALLAHISDGVNVNTWLRMCLWLCMIVCTWSSATTKVQFFNIWRFWGSNKSIVLLCYQNLTKAQKPSFVHIYYAFVCMCIYMCESAYRNGHVPTARWSQRACALCFTCLLLCFNISLFPLFWYIHVPYNNVWSLHSPKGVIGGQHFRCS